MLPSLSELVATSHPNQPSDGFFARRRAGLYLKANEMHSGVRCGGTRDREITS